MKKPFIFGWLVAAFVLLLPSTASAVSYQLPVDGSITDDFRPPATPYGAGNRGWEFATTAGASVKAAAAGTVTFAGQVGGVLNVVIKHDDGLLTTYSKLASVTVNNGDEVKGGQTIGIAAADTYFGARSNGEYINPATLFRSWPYLVEGPASTTTGLLPPTAQPMSDAQITWLSDISLTNALSQIHL